MKTTDREMLPQLKDQVQQRLKEYQEGRSALEIAAEIYGTLEGKGPTTSELMAQNVERQVEEYHKRLDACTENSDAFIRGELNKYLAEKSAVERCSACTRLLKAVTAYGLMCQGREDEAKVLENECAESSLTEEEARDREADLMEDVVEVLKHAPFAAGQIPGFLEQVRTDDFEGLHAAAAYGRDSKDLKLMLSMQMYVNAINGTYEDVGGDVSIEQVVGKVCGAMDTIAVTTQVEVGTLTEEQGENLLYEIGAVIGSFVLLGIVLFATVGLANVLMALSMGKTLAYVLGALAASGAFLDEKTVTNARLVGSCIMVCLGGLVKMAAGAVWNGLKRAAVWAKMGLQWLKERLQAYMGSDSQAHEVPEEAAPDTIAPEAEPVAAVECAAQPVMA